MVASKKERPRTRELIRWDDDKDIQILLGLVAHCNRNGIKLPWDEVAQGIGPAVTGNAVVQHLAKLRKKRVQDSEGGKAPGAYGNTKRASLSSKGRKGVISFQDDPGDIDPDKEDPDESYGERPSKKRASRGMKRIKDETSQNIGDLDDKITKAIGNISSKKRKLRVSYKDGKVNSVKNEDDSEAETNLLAKKTLRRTSNNFSEPTTDDSDDDEEYVATGAQFLSFNKRRPEKAISKQSTESLAAHSTEESLNIQEEVNEDGAPSKIISLLFKDKEALRRFPSSSAASEDIEMKEGNTVPYALPPYASSTHGMYGMQVAGSMPQVGLASGSFAQDPQYEMYNSQFAFGANHGLPAIAQNSQGYFPAYPAPGSQLRFASAPMHNEMFIGGLSNLQPHYHSYQTLQGMDPMSAQHTSFSQQATNLASNAQGEEAIGSTSNGGAAAETQTEETVAVASDDEEDEEENNEAPFSEFVHEF